MIVEKRQARLFKNREDNARWMKRLLRAATELKRIDVEYKRLMKGPSSKELKRRSDIDFPLGAAGGGVARNFPDDSLEGL